jgi:ketosteroid isomerase-like protein
MPDESTTPGLVELMRRIEDAAKRGDVAMMLSNFGPDSVWDDTAIGLGTHDGLEEIRAHLEDWIGSYEEFEIANEEVLDLGNGVTREVNLQKGRPVGSSGHVQLRYAGVTVWVDGEIERFTTYTDIDAARAVAERPRRGAGVGGVAGEFMTTVRSTPGTNGMAG